MDSCILSELNDGYIGIDILEISSIPDISILGNIKEDDCVNNIKKSFEKLLSEFYISSIERENIDYENQDYSLSLLFKSNEISNQTYKANVSIYIVIRGLSNDKNYLIHKIQEIKDAIKLNLSFSKYTTKEVSSKETLLNDLKNMLQTEKRLIIKETKNQNLQNAYLPSILTFDLFPKKSTNFTKIINTLMEFPNALIIFDLIPTKLNNKEKENLNYTLNTISLLKNEYERNQSNFSMILPDKNIFAYNYYEENQDNMLFAYNIVVASLYNANNISNNLISELSLGEKEEFINLKSVPLSNDEVDIETYFDTLSWVINEIVLDKFNSNNELGRLPFIITLGEASEFFRLPYGDNHLTAGINISKVDINQKEYNKKVIDNGDIMVGSLKNSNNNKIGFTLNDLTKHMLIVGTPGSGKTTFSVSLLDRIWKDFKIPFLVIEPAKNEYRAMIDSIPDIQVFTPGKDFISPYIINPFIPPKGVKLQSYKTVLKTAFGAAIQLTTPLDKIFEDTLDECYSRAGWLPFHTIEDEHEIFTMDDFLKTFMEVFERIGYKGEASNIGKAGYVRFKSLLRVFGSYNTIPIEDILTRPTIIELAAIENEEQKSLIIALLLLNIQSYVNANYVGDGEMRNLLLLEEAHVLLASSNSSFDSESPSMVAKKLLTRMLAEIRSLGVGIVIADQSPEKVTTDIVKLTNIKLAFNLVEKNDRQILGDSTDMKENQVNALAKLRPGEAYFYMNGLNEPEEVITEDYRKKVHIRTTISDAEIADKTTYWLTRQDKLLPHRECNFINCKNTFCDYKIKEEATEYARRIYAKYFNQDSDNKDKLKEVYKNILKEVEEYKKGSIDDKLLTCVKVHFLRYIYYETKILFSLKGMENTLKNELNMEGGD